MAGEKSKKSGEYGEEIAYNFLKLIGWTTVEKGVTIDCVVEEHERKSETHGIDGYFGYKSKLLQYFIQEDIIISVKHTIDEYPNSPTTLFKAHLKDISRAMHCFPHDSLYYERKIDGNTTKRKTFGVLFWISSGSDDDFDVVEKVKTFRNSDKIDYEPVYLVDNNRMYFILQSISYVKSKFFDYSFIYHPTGYNQNNPATSEDFGEILPVQLINTNILPMRVNGNDGSKNLVVSVNENFSEESLKRVLGFAKVLTNTWPNNIYILYSDFQTLKHTESVERVKSIFNDSKFTDTVKVKTYLENISSLGG